MRICLSSITAGFFSHVTKPFDPSDLLRFCKEYRRIKDDHHDAGIDVLGTSKYQQKVAKVVHWASNNYSGPPFRDC
jgi:hypothetical protein